jgi:hypothetical protein
LHAALLIVTLDRTGHDLDIMLGKAIAKRWRQFPSHGPSRASCLARSTHLASLGGQLGYLPLDHRGVVKMKIGSFIYFAFSRECPRQRGDFLLGYTKKRARAIANRNLSQARFHRVHEIARPESSS